MNSVNSSRRWRFCPLLALVGSAAMLVTTCSSGDVDRAGTTVGVDTTTPAVAAADRAGPVDIGGGRQIYLECRGTGEPTVVLVSGGKDGADVWSAPTADGSPPVFDGVATFSRVCAYDRPGTGLMRSTPVPQPTSAQDGADDLQKLLSASGEVGPYVLAGHSFGGPIIRVFASDHPSEVAGLVLIDGLSEDLLSALSPAQRAVYEELNRPVADPNAENMDNNATMEELAAASPPPPGPPVIVLTADRPQLTPDVLASGQLPAGVDQEFADALWAAQLVAQGNLAAKFSDAEHITDTQSSHYIQDDNPQLVIDSIREVVDTVRSPESEG